MTLRIVTIAVLLTATLAARAFEVRVAALEGEVRVRRGVEERWHPATRDLRLKEIDTILTGEQGTVTLLLEDGRTFELGPNAILDIADLRRIDTRELFLFLMRDKVRRIAIPAGSGSLNITNVSVVHGSRNTDAEDASTENDGEIDSDWVREKNGALALYEQDFHPNAVMRLHTILDRYERQSGCGELYVWMGRAFEALDDSGQAIGAYRHALEPGEGCPEGPWQQAARAALERLLDG